MVSSLVFFFLLKCMRRFKAEMNIGSFRRSRVAALAAILVSFSDAPHRVRLDLLDSEAPAT